MSKVNLNISPKFAKRVKYCGYESVNDLAAKLLNEWYRRDMITTSQHVTENTK